MKMLLDVFMEKIKFVHSVFMVVKLMTGEQLSIGKRLSSSSIASFQIPCIIK